MSRSRRVRAFVLAAALSLAAQSAWAGPRQPVVASGSAWAFLTQIWNAFTAGWSEVGRIIDPNGSFGAATAPPPETEVGCIADPNGSCGAGG